MFRGPVWSTVLLCLFTSLPVLVAVNHVIANETTVVLHLDDNDPVIPGDILAAAGNGCGLCRAGHPRHVHRWALPSNSCRDGGYYVGGSLPVRGEGRYAQQEGTWGWDYAGLLFTKRIALNWSHGKRYQGGIGAYKTEGPKLRHE